MKNRHISLVTGILLLIGMFIAAVSAQNNVGTNHFNTNIIESSTNVFSPSITADGKTMVFNSKRPGEQNYNIYISYYQDNLWATPALLVDVNSSFNDETPFITPDGNTLLFASDREGALRPSVTADGVRRITFDIFISTKANGKWSTPVPLAGDVNTIDNERTPTLSADKRTVYFSRWPFKAFQRSQIMSASLSGSKYVNPLPLPATVNSGYTETAPVPAPDGSGLYFSSRRPGGKGEWDIYFSPLKDGVFAKARNLGAEVNSTGNDLFINIFPHKIYLCSDRNNASGRYSIISLNNKTNLKHGDFKIYWDSNEISAQINRIKNMAEEDAGGKEDSSPIWISNSADDKIHLNIITADKSTGNPLPATVRLTYRDDNGEVLSVTEQACGADGLLKLLPQDGTSSVLAEVSRPGFVTAIRTLTVARGLMKEVVIELELEGEKSEKNRPANISFAPVVFATGSSEIRIDFYKSVYKAIDYLYDNPAATVSVKAYPDRLGTRDKKSSLSIKRAESVKLFIAERGIAANRIKTKSLTESELNSGNKAGLAFIDAEK